MFLTMIVIESVQVGALSALGSSSVVVTGGGVIDRMTALGNEVIAMLRVLGTVVGIAAGIGVMWKARFAVAGVAVGFFIGALIVFAVWNIDNATIRNMISGDLTSSPAAPALVLEGHEPVPSGLVG